MEKKILNVIKLTLEVFNLWRQLEDTIGTRKKNFLIKSKILVLIKVIVLSLL